MRQNVKTLEGKKKKLSDPGIEEERTLLGQFTKLEYG